MCWLISLFLDQIFDQKQVKEGILWDLNLRVGSIGRENPAAEV